MTHREHVELGLIGPAVLMVGAISPYLPGEWSLGAVIVVGCLAWLIQGGCRDLYLLYEWKRRPSTAPRRKLACMCLESSVAFTGLVIGIALTVFGFGQRVHFNPARWMLFATAVFTLGFLVKDYVITWRPLGLRRDPDHHAIIFTWR